MINGLQKEELRLKEKEQWRGQVLLLKSGTWRAGEGREGGGGGSIFFIGGTSGRLIPSNNTNIVGGRTRRLIKHWKGQKYIYIDSKHL